MNGLFTISYPSTNKISRVQLPPPLHAVPPRRYTCGGKTSLLQRIACSPRTRSHTGKCPSSYRGAPCHCRSCRQPKRTHLIRRSRQQHSRNIGHFYRATSSVHRLNMTSSTSHKREDRAVQRQHAHAYLARMVSKNKSKRDSHSVGSCAPVIHRLPSPFVSRSSIAASSLEIPLVKFSPRGDITSTRCSINRRFFALKSSH